MHSYLTTLLCRVFETQHTHQLISQSPHRLLDLRDQLSCSRSQSDPEGSSCKLGMLMYFAQCKSMLATNANKFKQKTRAGCDASLRCRLTADR